MSECEGDVCVHELPAGVYALRGEDCAADAAAIAATAVVLLNTPLTDPCDRFARLWNCGLCNPFFPHFLFLPLFPFLVFCCSPPPHPLPPNKRQPTPSPHVRVCVVGTATARVCADGAANRLLDAYGARAFDAGTLALPHVVVGDLDSVLPATLDFFRSRVCAFLPPLQSPVV